MNKELKEILKREAHRLDISMPMLKESPEFREGGYIPGILFVPSDMETADVLFLCLHELYHHRQYLYVQNHGDSYARILRREMEEYSRIPYPELYMEQEAFCYAYGRIGDYYPKYQPPCGIMEMIKNFKEENKK